jgi:MYXO-CTERM domain-containing protein
MMLDNPGYAMTGGFEPDVKKFLLVANTSRNLRADGSPEDKLAYDMVLVPAVVPETTGTDPQPDPNPDPGTDPDPTPSPDDSGAQVGGCSTSGSSSGGTLLLLGAAVAITIVRRRRSL